MLLVGVVEMSGKTTRRGIREGFLSSWAKTSLSYRPGHVSGRGRGPARERHRRLGRRGGTAPSCRSSYLMMTWWAKRWPSVMVICSKPSILQKSKNVNNSSTLYA